MSQDKERDRIKQLEKELDVARMIIGILRAQVRCLGHVPVVVENEAIGKAEAQLRKSAMLQ